MALPELESARLLLRPRQLADLDAIVRMNADPLVMRHIAAVGDPAMNRDAVAARSFSHIKRGLGYWSVFAKELPDEFTGYVGLIPDGEAAEEVQLSYRFEARHWGQGYAREAATCLLRHGFSTLGLARIGVTTHPLNAASLRLAERLGFSALPTDPNIVIGDPPIAAARLGLTGAMWQRLRPPGA
ncbi:Protein N-acetyltransferase, RimJ/RimL family [Hyphomicrobiales bacterium]|nr:Protein N-acetyltransferase, RimJ/RimL family [Hyphomicrobiales bacterium]CAH1700557.1 Protein N-acetyltransferase, RimJ/RimL family [Hyphomicrobiales bacterium]CAI0344405.1 (ribosomal protein S5)-alanine N-acetyltransferase [Hyphomicrobiales bacterium]